MKTPSAALAHQIACSNPLDELYEVVRVFTINKDDHTVRITIVRYYYPNSISYDAFYEREDDQGVFHSASFAKILTGGNDEESAIRNSINFVRDALKLGFAE